MILDADPLDDVGNVQKIHAVVLRGQLFDRRRLDDLVASAEQFGQKADQEWQSNNLEDSTKAALMAEIKLQLWKLLPVSNDRLVDRSRYIASVRDRESSDKALLGRNGPP